MRNHKLDMVEVFVKDLLHLYNIDTTKVKLEFSEETFEANRWDSFNHVVSYHIYLDMEGKSMDEKFEKDYKEYLNQIAEKQNIPLDFKNIPIEIINIIHECAHVVHANIDHDKQSCVENAVIESELKLGEITQEMAEIRHREYPWEKVADRFVVDVFHKYGEEIIYAWDYINKITG